jgi:membrane-bound inhibitor of C-type lysozyme
MSDIVEIITFVLAVIGASGTVYDIYVWWKKHKEEVG